MLTTSPEIQIEVEKLSAILRDIPIDGVASYDSLSLAVGYKVNLRPFTLLKARKAVENETGIRFGTVRGEGIKKLSSEAVAGIGAKARKTIAKKAASQAKRLVGLKYNDIGRDKQSRIDAERSLLGAIAATAKTKIERVERETETGPIVAAKIFEMMNRLD